MQKTATLPVGGRLAASVAITALSAARVLEPTPRVRGIVAARADAQMMKLITDMNVAFAEFKDQHAKSAKDQDGLVKAALEKLNVYMDEKQAEIDALNQKMAAMASAVGTGQKPLKNAEYSAAYQAYIQKGTVNAAMSEGSAPDGGYTTPIEWDRTITDQLKLVSPMRQVCQIQEMSVAGFSKLFNLHGTSSGWVGEAAARPNTNGPQFGTLQFGAGEIYANPTATQQLLDDSLIDLESWLAGEVELEFSKQEGAAFISGDGVNKPFGFLQYVTGAAQAAKHPFGAIEIVHSGAAATITSDAVINIIYELPSAYTGNAQFLMNRGTQRVIRTLKDGMGNYLWQPSYVAGQPATLAGYPITEMPDMPTVAAGNIPLAFGDFKRGYLILDRIGVRVLRDPFTNKPYVSFYTTKRVGGGVQNPDAIKVMEIEA